MAILLNLVKTLGNLGNFLYIILPVSVGRDPNICGSLLSDIYARGSKIFHTGGKCIICRGVHILPAQKCLHRC